MVHRAELGALGVLELRQLEPVSRLRCRSCPSTSAPAQLGAAALSLSAYSSELKPIEITWAWAK